MSAFKHLTGKLIEFHNTRNREQFHNAKDQSKEFNSVYSINDGVLINEDNLI